jgi:hypothetical protein
MEKEYQDHVAMLAKNHPDLANQITGWQGLASVLEWMNVKGCPPGAIDLIGQDEFAYDFLVELEAGGRWLAFGVT